MELGNPMHFLSRYVVFYFFTQAAGSFLHVGSVQSKHKQLSNQAEHLLSGAPLKTSEPTVSAPKLSGAKKDEGVFLWWVPVIPRMEALV